MNKTPLSKADIDEIIRVDHAGEYGAVRIYTGQLAVFEKRGESKQTIETIKHMTAQEEDHLERFNQLVHQHKVRPTALSPLWHMAGFALGAATALMGEKAAMACTEAVEEVIDDHYSTQIDALADNPEHAGLRADLIKFREEEREHRDTARAHNAQDAPAYTLLHHGIKQACHMAIYLSKKI